MTGEVSAFAGFFTGLKGESDRAAAVLGAAFLDALLDKALRKRLLPSLDKNAFENNGPLATFASRTTITHALGWIDADTKADLDLVRRIRNEFAHDPNHQLSFESQQIKSRTSQLKVMSAIEGIVAQSQTALGNSPEAKKAIEQTLANFGPARLRFELCIMMLAAAVSEATLKPAVDATSAASAPKIATQQLQSVVDAALKET